LDTLISQAYGGKAYELVGLHVQRAIVILTLFTIPVALIWSSSGFILHHLLFIDQSTARLAGTWSLYILPGLWPQLMFQILQRYLQGCGIVWPSIVANIVCASINIGGNYAFIDVMGMGFGGAALAVVLSQWSSLITISIMIWGQIVFDRRG
jgi:multidrug resistance protein, MATE family